MTEKEWLEAQQPESLLVWAEERGLSVRKTRLWACACVRMVWPLLEDPRSRLAVETAERFADGLATAEELAAAWNAAGNAAGNAAKSAAWDAAWDAASGAAWSAPWSAAWAAAWGAARNAARAEQANILRDIVANPFRPSELSMGTWRTGPCLWLTPAVLSLAQAAYDQHDDMGRLDQLRLAILSDALEEGGCDKADVLEHLRSPGPHYRGCWSLDMVLGKE